MIHHSTGPMTIVGLIALALGLVTLMIAQPASALMYECLDPTGRSIFTDSPSQGVPCLVIHEENPPALVSPASPLPYPVESGEQAEAVVSDAAVVAQSPRQITVPVFRVGRSLVVQARLNGSRDAKLIVDTGADLTILSNQVARDAGILPSSYISAVTLNTAGGPVRADMARLETIQIGTVEVPHVPVALHDLPDAPAGVDGLLGLTFLDKFLVTLDAQKGELQLRRRE